MSSDGSVTHWLAELKNGDSAAAQRLWERYFPKLILLAQQHIRSQGVPRAMADEEDVALSAIDSFCRAARNGRFPDLADRDGLWRLLLRMTTRKVVDLARHERRERRGGARIRSEPTPGRADGTGGLDGLIGDEPTPEFAAMMADQCRRLLKLLEPDLQLLATAKMEGYSNQEIAVQLGCSVRTIERRLYLIRRKWEQEYSG
jgi:DNA-directed RNA polymerase specialized sigma24 family protein